MDVLNNPNRKIRILTKLVFGMILFSTGCLCNIFFAVGGKFDIIFLFFTFFFFIIIVVGIAISEIKLCDWHPLDKILGSLLAFVIGFVLITGAIFVLDKYNLR